MTEQDPDFMKIARESIISLPGTIIPSTLKADFRQGLLKVKAKNQIIKKKDISIDWWKLHLRNLGGPLLIRIKSVIVAEANQKLFLLT